MSGLELCLQVFVYLEGLTHIFVHKKLIRDGQGDQKFSSIGGSLKIRKPTNEPEEDMLDSFLFSVDHVSLEIGIKITGVAQNFQESTDSLLGLVLGFLLYVNGVVYGV